MSPHVVTVATELDEARLRVLAEHLTAHHADATMTLLRLDDLVGDGGSRTSPWRSIRRDELPMPEARLAQIVATHTAEELSAVLAPTLLRLVLERTGGPVVLVPNDLGCFGPLDPLTSAALGRGLALVPRLLAADGDGAAVAADRVVAERGRFDEGFLAVGPDAAPMVAWWEAHSLAAGPPYGPTMLDLAAGLFSHEVCEHPGIGVAPWNIERRALAASGTGSTVRGQPLLAARFTGLDPHEPEVWCRRTGARDGWTSVVAGQARALRAAGHRPATANATSAIDRGKDGVAIPTAVRRALRDVPDDPSVPVPDPHGEAGSRGAMAWLERHRGLEAGSLTRWALPHGRPGDRPGVNVVGYASAEAGVGEMARLAVECLEAAGIDHAVIPLTTGGNQRERGVDAQLDGPSELHDVNLVVLPPSHLDDFVGLVGPSLLADRPTIGYWAWEVEAVPESMVDVQRLTDEVWGLSTFTADVLAAHLDVPVHPFVLPVREVPAAAASTRRAGDPPTFLFCFDHLSVFERKHPDGVVDAFRRAFAPGRARLIVKSINGHLRPESQAALERSAHGRSDIQIADGHLDADQQRRLMAGCDCYVSLHRAEGYGLTVAEAMMLGKPVIVTDYSGTRDFAVDGVAHLVPAGRSAVPFGANPYPVGTPWAEPDLDAAAAAMRRVADHPDEASAMGRRARAHLLDHHLPHHRASFVVERIAALRARFEVTAPVASPTRARRIQPASPRLSLR